MVDLCLEEIRELVATTLKCLGPPRCFRPNLNCLFRVTIQGTKLLVELVAFSPHNPEIIGRGVWHVKVPLPETPSVLVEYVRDAHEKAAEAILERLE